MKKLASFAAFGLFVVGMSAALANEKAGVINAENGVRGVVSASQPGELTGAQTFDRRFVVTYDGTCAASSSDSSNDGVAYQTFTFFSPGGQNADIEVVLGSLGDSVLFIYCAPFDPATPDAGLVAWDDDGGLGFGSAIVPADGVALEPGVEYVAVVTGFGPGDLGTFDIVLGGDLQFGSTLPEIAPVPVDNLWALLALIALLASVGWIAIRRAS